MEWELARLAHRATENEKRDRSGRTAQRDESRVFQTARAAIIKQQSAAAAVKPDQPEEEADVADARGDERLLRRGRGAWFVNPKPDQEIRGKADQFPADEEQKQAVGDNDAEHRGSEEGEIREEAGEIFVLRHVADAKDEDAERDERDHDQHRGRERIEDPTEPERLFAEGEPGEVMKRAPAGRLQRGDKGGQRENEGDHLPADRETGGGFATRIAEAQDEQRRREGNRGDQPKIGDDPGHHWEGRGERRTSNAER